MKIKLKDLNNISVGEISLDKEIFALELREDIVKQVVDWQRVKAMSGTHLTKTVSEVSGTTKKPFKQKGTGNARQGSLRSAQMRGGGVSHGPQVRSHATKLPKKVRKLGLKIALSAKLNDGKLFVVDSLEIDTHKSGDLAQKLKSFNYKSYFIIDGNEINANFKLSSQNISNLIAVPQIGANVYDILKHECVILSKDAVEALQERLR